MMAMMAVAPVAAALQLMVGKQAAAQIDYREQASQRLVDAVHCGDLAATLDCMTDPFVDVNFVGTVNLRSKRTEIALCGESPHEVKAEYEEFKTDATPLFLAAHAGDANLVRRLLNAGANVNQKLFRGYAITAAVREGHADIVEVLVGAGSCQPACREALLEASCVGQSRSSELLMRSQMIHPRVAARALILASARGFVDLVSTLIENGVDVDATDRVLLQSSKPSLHINADCSALVAAIIGRQVAVVRLLLQAGVRTDIEARLGAWSWDVNTGEEFRVGAGLSEPYSVAWCAVEYYETSGSILQMLLQRLGPETPHYGRTLIHHAILCRNDRALAVILESGGDVESVIRTASGTERPVHLASRLGFPEILGSLIAAGCDVNAQTGSGETALMACARRKQEECVKLLVSAGADISLVDSEGHSASSISESVEWGLCFHNAVLDGLGAQNVKEFCPVLPPLNDIGELNKKFVDIYVCSESKEKPYNRQDCIASNGIPEEVIFDTKDEGASALKSLHRAASDGDVETLRALIDEGSDDLNAVDPDGSTPLMLAAKGGHRSACELLISLGADCKIENDRQETALVLARSTGEVTNEVERLIFDELARKLVLEGGPAKKHTRRGKGAPHVKALRMVEGTGMLRWGKSRKRNVVCKSAEVGPSPAFHWNRRRRLDADEPGLFRIVTTRNKEVHFVCEGGDEMARMWVRGIEIVTREAIFGNK